MIEGLIGSIVEHIFNNGFEVSVRRSPHFKGAVFLRISKDVQERLWTYELMITEWELAPSLLGMLKHQVDGAMSQLDRSIEAYQPGGQQ